MFYEPFMGEYDSHLTVFYSMRDRYMESLQVIFDFRYKLVVQTKLKYLSTHRSAQASIYSGSRLNKHAA